MRSTYDGVKYYSANDMSLGLNFEKAKLLLNAFANNKNYIDINEIIELYNVNQIITSSGIKPEYSKPYFDKAQKLLEIVARFFRSISDDTLLTHLHNVCVEYIDDFWLLFEKFKVYENISAPVLNSILYEPETALYQILKHRGIVHHFDEIIAEYMRQSDQSARIIIGEFLEKKSSNAHEKCFLPISLKPQEYEGIIEKYINSAFPNVGVLQLIATSQSSAECPISDSLRLNARKKAESFWKSHANGTDGITYGIGVCFKRNPEIISYEEIKPLEYQLTYDLNWIRENLDYPSLLNNFIYLFSYVDLHYRCSFVSNESALGVFERSLGLKGIKEYEIGASFNMINIKSSAELQGYSDVLSEFNIRIEDLIRWFFTEYLKTEFNIDGFVINMPSPGSTTLEKCRTLPSEMDGVLKQFRMYVTDHVINRELLEMSSNPVCFHDLPSQIEKKYAYANNESIRREQFLLFSDQCMLHYLPQYKTARSFFELLRKCTVNISNYPEWATNDIKWLESRDTISIDSKGIIHMNNSRVRLLKDLYDHDVICPSYYKEQDLIEQLVSSGDLRFESSLFSIPEQHYLNYMLNKSEYSNGLDLRNKYIHSSYPLREEQQKADYLCLLKIFIIVILKINEECCLVDPK